jgi:hypothetical protein
VTQKTSQEDRPQRILLSGVFGPFGVDDAYGRKENIMELFHNQVTKAQDLGSWRYHHRSYGLYFLAANIDASVTVLDFPSRKRFMNELEKGYDVVGISFITPNFIKAKEMARLTRRISPESTIVLGGHGAAIEGVEDLIDCDHVVKGEGIPGAESGRPLCASCSAHGRAASHIRGAVSRQCAQPAGARCRMCQWLQVLLHVVFFRPKIHSLPLDGQTNL